MTLLYIVVVIVAIVVVATSVTLVTYRDMVIHNHDEGEPCDEGCYRPIDRRGKHENMDPGV